MPVVLQFVSKQRLVLSWAEPQVVVNVLIDLQWLVTFANRHSPPNSIHLCNLNSTQCFFLVQKLLNFSLHWVRALLRTNLADLVVLTSRRNRLLAFPLSVRKRLFNINMLTSFHRPNRCQTMPMIASSNNDGIDTVRLEHVAQVAPNLSFRVDRLGLLNSFLIRVAQPCDVDFLDFGKLLSQPHRSSAATDHANVNRFDCTYFTRRPQCRPRQRHHDSSTRTSG